jgi:hypothetical protein
MKKYMNCINFFKFCKNSYIIGKFLNMGEFGLHLDSARLEGLVPAGVSGSEKFN